MERIPTYLVADNLDDDRSVRISSNMYEGYAASRGDGMPNIETSDDSSKIRRYRAIKEHLFSDLTEEAVLLSLKNGKYYGVNHVGAAIWSIIQQPVTLSEIESSLMEQYEVDEETCRTEVETFLENMIREELIDVIDE